MYAVSTAPSARATALLALLVATGCASSATTPRATAGAAVAQTEEGAFITLLGRDTLAVERFTRNAERVEGRQVLRTPRTSVRDYTATLRPDGSISRFELSVRPSVDAQPTMRATMDFGGDSATVQITRGDSTQTLRVAAGPGAIPSLGVSFALYELPLVQLRTSGRDSLEVPLVPIGGTQAAAVTLRTVGTDSVLIRNIAGTNRARVDPSGRLLTFDGRGSTFQVVVERLPTLDVDALAAAFAARDQQGQALGSLSPRDSAQVSIGGANLMIEYGRPMRRGRTIFGGIVPYGQVWRTGANQATHFRTDRELVIGGTTIPAGTYTLWTIPSPGGWTLIVNRQTGQGGTEYDQAQDLARIEMQRETLPEPVEQFTIALEPRGQREGVLRMMWEDTQVSVPFMVR